MSLLCSPLHWLRVNTSFLSPPNSVIFILLQGLRRPRFWWATAHKLLPCFSWGTLKNNHLELSLNKGGTPPPPPPYISNRCLQPCSQGSGTEDYSPMAHYFFFNLEYKCFIACMRSIEAETTLIRDFPSVILTNNLSLHNFFS